MATSQVNGLDPVTAVAAIGVLGVGAQWIAWRLRIPAIVFMLLMGVIAGPVTGFVDPKVALGDLMGPIISIAVAVILLEGGLTLNFHSLRDAAQGVRRLVFIGAPLGWLLSTAALYYGAGLGLAASAVFGGILIVTGPTVIVPLLRQAKLARRPASLLQWEAIVNDPIGALAAVLAFEFVLVQSLTTSVEHAAMTFVLGIGVAAVLGYVAGRGLAVSFRNG
jgi:NhaP-type Na+/H+ or K+/H+ antiporter